MSKIDTSDRIELDGAWSGFGFQNGRMFTPEGHALEPADMAWWSLTCNIASEWRRMMEDARAFPDQSATTTRGLKKTIPAVAQVVCLRNAIRKRRERRFAVVAAGPDAEHSNVVRFGRGPNRQWRG